MIRFDCVLLSGRHHGFYRGLLNERCSEEPKIRFDHVLLREIHGGGFFEWARLGQSCDEGRDRVDSVLVHGGIDWDHLNVQQGSWIVCGLAVETYVAIDRVQRNGEEQAVETYGVIGRVQRHDEEHGRVIDRGFAGEGYGVNCRAHSLYEQATWNGRGLVDGRGHNGIDRV